MGLNGGFSLVAPVIQPWSTIPIAPESFIFLQAKHLEGAIVNNSFLYSFAVGFNSYLNESHTVGCSHFSGIVGLHLCWLHCAPELS